MKSPFMDAKHILEKLHNAGHEAYFVGGAVRDYLLNRQIGDVDIATSAKPGEVRKLFSKTIDVGAEHGTIIVLSRDNTYEVTTYRSESDYEDFRRPKTVSYITSLKEDLRRRDFTINAMAMDIKGSIQDYFGGETHLKQKIIKTVGAPEERFREDALRMLRALRFSSQLDFTLCKETKEAICSNIKLLQAISVERKTAEIEKLLKGSNYRNAIELIVDTNMNLYLPGLSLKENELIDLSRHRLDLLATKEELWTLLTYCIAPDSIPSYLRSWKLPVKIIKAVEKNIHYLKYLNNQQWNELLLYEAGYDTAIAVERIRSILSESTSSKENVEKVKNLHLQLPIQSRTELAITGHDLINTFRRKPGPWIAKTITEIERAVLLKEIENKSSAIKEWLLKCKQDFEQNY